MHICKIFSKIESQTVKLYLKLHLFTKAKNIRIKSQRDFLKVFSNFIINFMLLVQVLSPWHIERQAVFHARFMQLTVFPMSINLIAGTRREQALASSIDHKSSDVQLRSELFAWPN